MNATIYHKNFRPIKLQEYIKNGADILEIKKNTFTLVRTVNNLVIEKYTYI